MIEGNKAIVYYTQEDIVKSDHATFRAFIADLYKIQCNCIILDFPSIKYFVANDNMTLMAVGYIGKNVTQRKDLEAADAKRDPVQIKRTPKA